MRLFTESGAASADTQKKSDKNSCDIVNTATAHSIIGERSPNLLTRSRSFVLEAEMEAVPNVS